MITIRKQKDGTSVIALQYLVQTDVLEEFVDKILKILYPKLIFHGDIEGKLIFIDKSVRDGSLRKAFHGINMKGKLDLYALFSQIKGEEEK